MRWNRTIYTGSFARKRKRPIVRAIRQKKPQLGVYVICRALDSDGLLDISHNVVFLMPAYQKKDPLILGIAVGRKEAFEVAREIVDALYKKNGDFDIDAFCDPRNP